MAEISSYKKDIIQVFDLDLPWEKLSGCNIIVAGATGLIGGCLVETLMMNPNIDYQVYASGRNKERARQRFSEYWGNSAFHFIQYDVLKPLQSNIGFDFIIHAASNASPNFFANNPVEVVKSNVEGVINLMEYGLKHEMKRFLYVSSGEVYGEGDGRVFSEDYSGYVDCTTPRACYPSSKRVAETLCASYAAEYGADVVIARPSHTFGPYFTEQDNRVYAQFIRNILNQEDIVMKSNGEQYRSWCYVVDVVSALLYVLLKGECGQAYNIADNQSNVSIRKLAEIIAAVGKKKVLINMPSSDEIRGYNPVKKSVFSTEKIKKLGWRETGSLEINIMKTIKEQNHAVI